MTNFTSMPKIPDIPNVSNVKEISGLPGISNVTDILTPSIDNIRNLATQMQNAPGMLKSMFGGMADGQTASTILGIAPDIVKKSFLPSLPQFIDTNLPANMNLGNMSTGLNDQIKKYSSSTQAATSSFQNSSKNLQKDGLVFVASTTSKMVDGIDLPGFDQLSSFGDLGIGQLGKLASMGERALNSVGHGLTAVTKSLGGSFDSGKTAAATLNNLNTPTAGAVTAPATKLAFYQSTQTDPRTINRLAQTNQNYLPANLSDVGGYQYRKSANNYSNSRSSVLGAITDKAFALTTIIDSVQMAGFVDGLFNFGDGLGNSGYNANGIAGPGGSYLHGQSGYGGTGSQYDQLAQAIRTICKDVNLDDWMDFGDEQDLFDILMQILMDTNAGKLLEALLNCGQSNQYNTGRTRNIVTDGLGRVATSGDTYSYRALINSYGSGVSRDPRRDALGLYTNARYTDENDSAMDEILDKLGYTKKSLSTRTKIGRQSILDADTLTLMQRADRRYQPSFADQMTYAAVNAAVALFRD